MSEERCPMSYMAHRRAGEKPCAQCRAAWRDRQREYRLRRNIDPAR